MSNFYINGERYFPTKLLGKGKGGYSYLCHDEEGVHYVVKKIHHEPCSFYKFGNKIQAEMDCYDYLLKCGIRVPECYYIDLEQELVLKEYIRGRNIADMIKRKQDVSKCVPQVEEMARLANENGVNIDYYPANFILRKGLLYYIDYETSKFDKRYTFENWGRNYWIGKKSLDK
ncbi:MAG: hypothetical protein LKF75_01780 [Bacilli bacterium]|nr:hypothetical protein [Bacilli bacterium]MCH4210241.1 hypothetical protein [Bacilli bacterium]MCH4228423.1 hypothetical protein [Bacilli bacterium]MCH4278025.1 hypothetical protein [Bacilli bacterium]MCI2055153.1 hypothetical protein [Bacilli bacterium]